MEYFAIITGLKNALFVNFIKETTFINEYLLAIDLGLKEYVFVRNCVYTVKYTRGVTVY